MRKMYVFVLQKESPLTCYNQVNWDKKEDDEICAELRSLAREYREQVKINDSRKKKLLEIVDCQLQFEQYRQVLDTLDNQVEQGYIKRYVSSIIFIRRSINKIIASSKDKET